MVEVSKLTSVLNFENWTIKRYCIIILLSCFGFHIMYILAVKADELVMCYEGQSCDGAVTFNTTIVDCCDNQMQPVGRSYQHTVNDTVIDECQSCPVGKCKLP